jgi:hypothetical protein
MAITFVSTTSVMYINGDTFIYLQLSMECGKYGKCIVLKYSLPQFLFYFTEY